MCPPDVSLWKSEAGTGAFREMFFTRMGGIRPAVGASFILRLPRPNETDCELASLHLHLDGSYDFSETPAGVGIIGSLDFWDLDFEVLCVSPLLSVTVLHRLAAIQRPIQGMP
jgi:hypothetical protein